MVTILFSAIANTIITFGFCIIAAVYGGALLYHEQLFDSKTRKFLGIGLPMLITFCYYLLQELSR